MSGDERRGAARVPFDRLATFAKRRRRGAFGPLSLGKTLDISSSGVRFLAFAEIEPGDVLEMEIAMADEIEAATVRVVRVDAGSSEAVEVGAVFDPALAREPIALRSLLRRIEPPEPVAEVGLET